MKRCIKCNELKPLSEFYKGTTEKDKLKAKCKRCYLKGTRNWRIKNPDYMKKYSLNNRKNSKERYGLSVKTIERHGLKTALLVYDRANRKCELCNNENDLTIHHKDNKGRNLIDVKLKANNNINNLMILCRSCHGKLHTIQRWKKYGKRKSFGSIIK